MPLPSIDAVDARLAELLDAFGPGEITARQRAEDLVASALTFYGGALRRARELLDEHGASSHLPVWTGAQPLGGLLALHRADTPAPPPIDADDVQRAAATIENILDELDAAPPPVRERSTAMLAAVTDLHGAGFAQLVGALDDHLRPPPAVVHALGRDDLVASLLLVHGLHPDSLPTRLARTLDEVRRLAGPSATVELVDLHAEIAHLRIEGDSPGDAYRLRLTVERAIADDVPDLTGLRVDGGDEPVPPTSVFIPIDSVTVRHRDRASTADLAP